MVRQVMSSVVDVRPGRIDPRPECTDESESETQEFKGFILFLSQMEYFDSTANPLNYVRFGPGTIYELFTSVGGGGQSVVCPETPLSSQEKDSLQTLQWLGLLCGPLCSVRSRSSDALQVYDIAAETFQSF